MRKQNTAGAWNRRPIVDIELNETRYTWTDEGRVDLRKVLLNFNTPKVLQVRRRSFGRTGCSFSNNWVQGFFKCVLWCLQALKRARRREHAIHHCLLFYCSPGMSCEACTWLRSKIGRDNATDQWEIWDRPAESSERSWTLPVGSKVSFRFRSSASEVPAKWPIDARTRGHLCSTDTKSFASPQLVWTGWWTYNLATERQSLK